MKIVRSQSIDPDRLDNQSLREFARALRAESRRPVAEEFTLYAPGSIDDPDAKYGRPTEWLSDNRGRGVVSFRGEVFFTGGLHKWAAVKAVLKHCGIGVCQ